MKNAPDWKFVFTDMGGNDAADTNQGTGVTRLDNSLQGNVEATVGVLSHELGHADFDLLPDESTFPQFRQAQEYEEGYATVQNIKADSEIFQNSNSGIEVGVQASTLQIAQQEVSDFAIYGSNSGAYNSIGTLYDNQIHGGPEGPESYYDGWVDNWNKNHPTSPWPPKPNGG